MPEIPCISIYFISFYIERTSSTHFNKEKYSILNTYDGSDRIDEADNIHRWVFSFSFEPEK